MDDNSNEISRLVAENNKYKEKINKLFGIACWLFMGSIIGIPFIIGLILVIITSSYKKKVVDNCRRLLIILILEQGVEELLEIYNYVHSDEATPLIKQMLKKELLGFKLSDDRLRVEKENIEYVKC